MPGTTYSVFLSKRPFNVYKTCIGKIGDLAERIPLLDKIPFPNQLNAWNAVDRAIEKSPKVFLKLASEKNGKEKEITDKLDLLLQCLQELNISEPVTLHMSSIDPTVEQLECIYEVINDLWMEDSKEESKDENLLIETRDLILELRDLLQDYKKILDRSNEREAERYAKERLKDNPLLAKLLPLTLVSSAGAISAFGIDQQGILPPNWNPNKYASDTILSIASSILTQVSCSMGSLYIDQDKPAAILANVTVIAGTCALAPFDDRIEEDESGYLEYLLNSLVNQVFVFTFAYLGTRFCGSKEKVKGFVENRISSTIAYKACNATLGYLGIPFWPSKGVSLLASGVVNPLLSLVD